MALHRILLNLLGNAIKFTHEGHIQLVAQHLESSNPNEAFISLCVSDTGIGIPKASHQIIFEKFHRLSPTAQCQYKGTGLGLYFVKSEIERMNGSIELESEEGNGASFTCTIPLRLSK